MAQRGHTEKLSCSICLDLLKDPVTIPCGHSYCMSCINDCWNEEKDKETPSCPQCRQTFPQRPVLVKSTILAELVEELKKEEPQAASPDPPGAGPEDVVCDFCIGKKLKAVKSCLVCMASYCEQHVQSHFTVALLKKHKLVEATLKLQENICSRHDEVMKIYCRTDQQCICYLCSMDDHKGHDTVSAAAERAERQTELGLSRQKIQQRVQDRERDVKLLQQRVEAFNLSADEAVRDSEKSRTELIRLIEKRCSEVTQQIRDQQKTQVGEATELEQKLQQEITDLRRKDAELEKLSHTEDHLHFLNNYPSLSRLSQPEDCPSIDVCPLSSFKDVTAAVTKVRDKLEAVLSENWGKIPSAVTGVEVSPAELTTRAGFLSESWGKVPSAVTGVEVSPAEPTTGAGFLSESWGKVPSAVTGVEVSPAEPTTRAGFLRYSRQITLDPNTVNRRLSLSDGNRKATLVTKEQVYTSHPDRFVGCWQVLSTEGLTGRCYWEVKWSGRVDIAVAYKDIKRIGTRNKHGFGNNDKSWSLKCGYTIRHNRTNTFVSGPQSSKIGVYLDHEAGTLSYYSVSDTMTLLHRVQTTFSQPLYPGVLLPYTAGSSAEFIELK